LREEALKAGVDPELFDALVRADLMLAPKASNQEARK
jgi:hypothetical protein